MQIAAIVRLAAALMMAAWVVADAHDPSTVLSVHRVLAECGGPACQGTIQVRGWLYTEYEMAALYESTVAARSKEYRKCLGVVLPPSVRRQLERFQRSQVVLEGTLNGLSESGVCGSASLRVSKVVSVSSDKDDSGSWPVNALSRVKASSDVPHGEDLRSLARQFVLAFAKRDLPAIQHHFASDLWSRIAQQLSQPDSRLNFLLAERKALLGKALSESKPQIDFLQSADDSDSVTACICKRDKCDPTQATVITYYQSFADPYFCFSATIEDQQWYINDFMLVDIVGT